MSTRIVVKPAGAAVIVIAIIGLGVLAINGSKTASIAVPTRSTGEENLLQSEASSEDTGKGWHTMGATLETGDAGVLKVSTVAKTPAKEWNNMAIQPLRCAFKKGERVAFSGWLRSPQSFHTAIYLEPVDSPSTKILYCWALLTPEWQEFHKTVTLSQDFAPGEVRVTVHLGSVAGTVEMKQFRLQRLPPLPDASPSAGTP